MQTLTETKRWGTGAVAVVGPGCWVPAVPPHFVRRERLEVRLNDAARSPLTVVEGMAGAGKSVLLAGWARRREAGTTAWLGLESDDNDPVRFWSRLVRALQVVDPDVGDDVVTALSAGVSNSRVAEALVGELAVARPVVVVLDDLHRLTRFELLQAVADMAGHLPSHVRLIVTSRQSCGLGFHRLRMSGDLVEIDQDELRFRDEEASRLLTSVAARPLPSGDIEVLTGRTEGWAAGLRLADLTLADKKDGRGSPATFDGGSRLVAEYFQHEVLAGLPPDTVRFMMETSGLEVITAGVSQEVTGRADAGAILDDLADRHLFTFRLDAGGTRYRYHRLLAEFLRHRLVAQHPDGARRARLRAASWLQRNGHGRAAFDHLVQGLAYDQALAVAAADVVSRFAGGEPTVGEALLPGEIPPAYLKGNPWRMYLVAAALISEHRTSDAAGWLQRLTRLVPDTPEAAMLRVRAEMLWTIHDGLRWDAAGVLEHYERVGSQVDLSRHLSTGVPLAVSDTDAWVGSLDVAVAARLPLIAAWAHLWLGQPDEARTIVGGLAQDKSRVVDVASLALKAALAHRDGRLRDASDLARTALDEADRDQGADTQSALAARLTLASVRRERNELDGAYQLLTEGLGACQQQGRARSAAAFACELIPVVMAQGRHLDGFDRLRQLRQIDADIPLPEPLRRKLDRVEIRCRLALGDLEGARLILNSIPAALLGDEILARVDLSAGRPDRAEQRLTSADQAKPMRAQIERLVLMARAQLQLGKRSGADDALRRGLELGRPDRYVRVFLDDADHLLDLMRGIGGRYRDTYLSELVDSAQTAAGCSAGAHSVEIVEPLSGREREVLGHLPTHLSQREIADTMYVSINTVKSHTAAVYRKLGATSRSQAVRTAQLHGLL